MKVLFIINLLFYVLVLGLYAEPILGLAAQFCLGVFQVSFALIMYFFYRRLTQKVRTHLNRYACFVILYFAFMYLEGIVPQDLRMMVGYFYLIGVPMIIGAYFIYISYLVSEQQKETSHV